MKRHAIPLLWGACLGLAAASFLWGSSARAGFVIGEKIVFTLVIPLALLVLCLAVTMAAAGRNGAGPPAR
jgi:hypothetical protein